MTRAIIDAERCKACGLCIQNCKSSALRMTKCLNSRGYKHVELLPQKCVGCGICYIVCPDGVFEIAE